jgi:hypothetical protein
MAAREIGGSKHAKWRGPQVAEWFKENLLPDQSICSISAQGGRGEG